MANQKVSEMTELQANDIADDDIVYIVDTSEGTNGSKKVSIASLRSAIGVSDLEDTSGTIYNGNIPDWGSMIIVSSTTGGEQSVTLPCDCFVQYYAVSSSSGTISKSCTVDSTPIQSDIAYSGFYCGAGSVIKIDKSPGTSTTYYLRVVPLVYANTMEDGIVTIENQTPQQIT